MKASLLRHFVLLCVLLFFVGCSRAESTPAGGQFRFGLSSSYSLEDLVRVSNRLEHVLATAPAGAFIHFDDVSLGESICSLTVPKLVKDTPANRKRIMAEPLARLAAWLDPARFQKASAALRNSARLDPVAYFRHLASPAIPRPDSVILLGSPFQIFPAEPSCSMCDALYPSDAHLGCRAEVTPHGTAELTNRLAGVTVHWCYLSSSVWSNDWHRACVTRWWVLYTGVLGANLASFSQDLDTVMEVAFRRNLPPVEQHAARPDDTKVEMRTAGPRELPHWMRPIPASTNILVVPAAPTNLASVSVTSATNPLFSSPVRPLPPSIPEPSSPDKSGIGIMWSQRIDLDLYVRTQPGDQDLFFQHPLSEKGRYRHDYRNRNEGLDYEYVELNASVDFKQVRAWVNFFDGSASPVVGTVCVHHQGRTYRGEFSITAEQGNHGADSGARDSSTFWTELDLAAIVGLPPSP